MGAWRQGLLPGPRRVREMEPGHPDRQMEDPDAGDPQREGFPHPGDAGDRDVPGAPAQGEPVEVPDLGQGLALSTIDDRGATDGGQ